MRIREFMGIDFEPAARILGDTWHKEHGGRAYWQGADELCSYLARCDKGYVAFGDVTVKEGDPIDGDAMLGVILVASPREEDRNKDLRLHWLQQRTSVAFMANALGINARADAALLNEEHELMEHAGAEFGIQDVGEIVLLIVTENARGQGVGRELLRKGIAWLLAHDASRVRLVTDDDCDWQAYEHLGMQRVLEATAITVTSKEKAPFHMYVYEASGEELAQRIGTESAAPQYQLLPSEETHNDAVGELLGAHSSRAGVPFVEYNYHIEKDGRLVAGIVAWALGSDVHIDMLAVDESEQRHGLGSRLLTHVEKQAREDGCTTASVDTFSFQAPDYYPAHGYVEVFRYTLDDGNERIYFSKRLCS